MRVKEITYGERVKEIGRRKSGWRRKKEIKKIKNKFSNMFLREYENARRNVNR